MTKVPGDNHAKVKPEPLVGEKIVSGTVLTSTPGPVLNLGLIGQVKQSVSRQRQVIANLIDLQKQFPKDSASWRHVEDMMGDLASSIDLLVH